MKRLLLVLICLLVISPVVSGMSLSSDVPSGSTVFTGDTMLLSATGNGYVCAMKTSGGCNPYGDPVPGLGYYNPYGFTNVSWTVPAEFVSGYIKFTDATRGETSNCIYYTKSGGTRISAAFTADVVSGAAPLTVHFTDTSTGGPPTSWYWAVSSGSYTRSDTVQNPTFTLSDPGIYTVSMTATNGGDSDTETKTGYITVGGYYSQLFRVFDTTSLAVVPSCAIQVSDGQSGTGSPVDGSLTLNVFSGTRTAQASKVASGYKSAGATTFSPTANGQYVNLFVTYTGGTAPTPSITPTTTGTPAPPPTPAPTATPTPVPTTQPGIPSASFTYADNVGTLTRPVILTSTSTSGEPITSYAWFAAYPDGSIVSIGSASSVTLYATQYGSYNVQLRVDNALGYDTETQYVTVAASTIPTASPTPTPVPTATPVPTPTQAGGGTLSWDKSIYTTNDPATITYSIYDGYYQDSTYTYSVKIVSGITGAVVATYPIATQTGTVSISSLPASSYPAGTYYADLYWVLKADPTQYNVMKTSTMTMTGYATVAGTVYDGVSALPVMGANVRVTQSTTTDESSLTLNDGKFSVGGLTTNTLITVTTNKAGYYEDIKTLTAYTGKLITSDVTLTPIGVIPPLPDVPVVTGSNVVTVNDTTTGAGIPGATVEYLQQVSPFNNKIYSMNAAGQYTPTDAVTPAQMGEYIITASAPGYETYQFSYTQTGTYLTGYTISLQNTTIPPTPPDPIKTSDYIGLVRNGYNHTPIAGASVIFYSNASIYEATTDANGEYTCLPSWVYTGGYYVIDVSAPGYESQGYTDIIPTAARLPAFIFDLYPQVIPTPTPPEPTFVTTGYVRTQSNAPINGALVVFSQSGTSQLYQTGSTGAYTTTGVANDGTEMNIAASASGFAPSNVTFIPAGAGSFDAYNFYLSSYTPDNPPVTGTHIAGVVRNRINSAPIPYAVVSIRNDANAENYTVAANSVGYYTSPDLTFGGVYNVFSSLSGFYNSPTSVVTAGV